MSAAASLAAPSPDTRGRCGMISAGASCSFRPARSISQLALSRCARRANGTRSVTAHVDAVRDHALDAGALDPGQLLEARLRGPGVEAEQRAGAVEIERGVDVAVGGEAVAGERDLLQAEARKLGGALDAAPARPCCSSGLPQDEERRRAPSTQARRAGGARRGARG